MISCIIRQIVDDRDTHEIYIMTKAIRRRTILGGNPKFWKTVFINKNTKSVLEKDQKQLSKRN